MNDWNIQSRSHACRVCERPFADREPYHTLLVEVAEGLERSDLCRACWEADAQRELRSRTGFLSHWQGVYEVPPPVSEPIQKENAESLLRKLIQQEDRKYIPAAYILAVMLERKRILKVKEEWRRDGQRCFVYEHAASGDVFTIIDPELQLDQLESVQREVSLLMERGMDAAPPNDAASSEIGPSADAVHPVGSTPEPA